MDIKFNHMDVKTVSQALSVLAPDNMSYCSGLITKFQDPLSTDEFVISSNASQRRKAEFIAGRNCLRQAIKPIYGEEFSIHRSEDGKPELPPAVVGSISHKHPFVVSLAALRAEYDSLGIDIETVENWNEKTTSVFVNNSDKRHLHQLNIPFDEFFSMLFSAKESAYKALNDRHSDQSLSIHSISPKFFPVSKGLYDFSVQSNEVKCCGRLQFHQHWMVSVCWAKRIV